MDMAEILKFKILMCLLNGACKSCSVTGIARELQEKKYTVSRAMIRMEQDGLLDRRDIRAPALTSRGQAEAQRYRDRYEIALNHLLYEGVDPAHAEKDACVWALGCSDEMTEVIRTSDERLRVKMALKNEERFDGAALCRQTPAGPSAILRRKKL